MHVVPVPSSPSSVNPPPIRQTVPTLSRITRFARIIFRVVVFSLGLTAFVLLFIIAVKLANRRVLYEFSFHNSLKQLSLVVRPNGNNKAPADADDVLSRALLHRGGVNSFYSLRFITENQQDLETLAQKDRRKKQRYHQDLVDVFGEEIAEKMDLDYDAEFEAKLKNKVNLDEEWKTQAPASQSEVQTMKNTKLQELLPKTLQLVSSSSSSSTKINNKFDTSGEQIDDDADDSRTRNNKNDLYHSISLPNGVEHLFIAANLHNSEDILPLWLREMKRFLLFLSDPPTSIPGIDSKQKSSSDATAGSQFRKKKIFLSIFTNVCKDRTNTILRHDFIPWLLEHEIPFNLNLEGQVEGGYRVRPEGMERILWLSKVRNAAIQPWWDDGMRLFFEDGDRMDRIRLMARAKGRLLFNQMNKENDYVVAPDRKLLLDGGDGKDAEGDNSNKKNDNDKRKEDPEEAVDDDDKKHQQAAVRKDREEAEKAVDRSRNKQQGEDSVREKLQREQEEMEAVRRATEQEKQERLAAKNILNKIKQDNIVEAARKKAESAMTPEELKRRLLAKAAAEKDFQFLSEERIARRKTQQLLSIPAHELPDVASARVLFLNDIIFTAEDLLVLLHTNQGNYDMTCGMDFYWNFYDTWVSRDLNGKPFWSAPPFSESEQNRMDIQELKPTQVSCCWNGAMFAKAAVFLKELGTEEQKRRFSVLSSNENNIENNNNNENSNVVLSMAIPKKASDENLPIEFQNPLKFSHHAKNVAFRDAHETSHCPVSECLLLCKDMQMMSKNGHNNDHKFDKIFINPVVRVGYLLEDYLNHHGKSFALDVFESTAWVFSRINSLVMYNYHAQKQKDRENVDVVVVVAPSGDYNKQDHNRNEAPKLSVRMSPKNQNKNNNNEGNTKQNETDESDNCDLSTMDESDTLTRHVVYEMGFVCIGSVIFVADCLLFFYRRNKNHHSSSMVSSFFGLNEDIVSTNKKRSASSNGSASEGVLEKIVRIVVNVTVFSCGSVFSCLGQIFSAMFMGKSKPSYYDRSDVKNV